MNQSVILGLDMGNYNYKDNNGILIPARLTQKSNLLEENPNYINYQDKKYYIGVGELEINLNKANKVNNDVLMLAVLDQYQEIFFKLVLGLPTNYYKVSKDNLRNKLLDTRIYNYKSNGTDKQKIIEDVIVFPEGAGAYFSISNRPKNAVIIDIGGKTCNLVQFTNGKLDNNFSTIGQGMIDLYSSIRDYLNQKYILNLTTEAIENILKEGLYIDGTKVDMAFIKPIIANYIEKIINELRLNFSIRTHKIFITGGGSVLLGRILERKLGNADVLSNYMFANAEGFYKVGCSKWQ